jgi:hypothetical protein
VIVKHDGATVIVRRDGATSRAGTALLFRST